ncbi:transcriptional regulator, Crp/Fnr family [gamma proteobacterium NOR5-3]|nr:transcriptional regulator, Crp/Fnr family [gamma proteobacterium NOR5-3]
MTRSPGVRKTTAELARDTLLSSDLCRGLDAALLTQLETIAQPQIFAANQLILRQGRVTDAIYLPCSGSQIVERSAAGGQRQVLAFLQRGDYLGFSTSNQFLYSARALEQSIVLRFPGRDFYALASTAPTLRDNVGQITNQVLARVLDHLFAIGQKRAHERLAFLLWQLWQRQAKDSQRATLELPMRRGDIGDYLGLTLETTSRAFSRLRKDDVIASEGRNRVQILDTEALGRLAEVE